MFVIVSCAACQHPQRPELEAALRRRESFRQVARTYRLSPTKLHRHAHRHVPEIARARAEPQAPPGSRRCVDCGRLYTDGSKFRCRACLDRPREALRKFSARGRQERTSGRFDPS